MSRKEVPRVGIITAAVAGKITNREGARALRVSVRHFKRLKARFRRAGAAGLLHRSRGRPTRRGGLRPRVRQQVLRLMTTTYAGFNDVHLTEKLQQVHDVRISRSTVRRLRRSIGRPAQRPRRPPRHRSRRPRAPALGQLVQLDASLFAWFETRGPMATLHGLIDDATSIPLALSFRPTEDLHGYTTVLAEACRRYGVPVTLYGDRLGLFRRNDAHWSLEEQLRGRQDPTHFGTMLQDLGIGFIAAQSPQAKGRIERLWGTLQDRLVSELRLRRIATLEAANAFLPHFLPGFIRRFARPPADAHPAWRAAPRDLDRLLSCRYSRTVARDNTVHLATRGIQIPPGPGRRSYAGCRVEVRELLDGRVMVFYRGARVAVQPAPATPFVLKPRSAPGRRRLTPQRARRQATALRTALQTLQQLTTGRRRARPVASPPPPPARRRATHTAPPRPSRPPRVQPAARTPPPTHRWRVPFSARERQRQRPLQG